MTPIKDLRKQIFQRFFAEMTKNNRHVEPTKIEVKSWFIWN